MRKLIALIIGCLISYYLYLHWQGIYTFLGKDIATILLIYVVALGVIHIGGISLKILAVVFATIATGTKTLNSTNSSIKTTNYNK